MPDDMVERVALALYESGCIRSDEVLNHLARAAIEAMREPTPEMRAAAACYLGQSIDVGILFSAMIDAALQKDEANAG